MADVLQQRYEEELKRRLGEQGAAEYLKKYPGYGGYAGPSTGGAYVTPSGTVSTGQAAVRAKAKAPASGATQRALGVPQVAVPPALQEALSQIAKAPPTFKPPAYTAQERPGQLYDFSNLFGAITQYGQAPIQAPQAQTPQVFTFEDLLSRINQMGQAGGAIPVPEARYQTPEQLTQLQQTWLQALQPLIESQTRQAQESYGQSIEALRNQWAARGLLGGTAPALEEAGTAERLARAVADIQAQAQAQALAGALNYAQLGLGEQGQLWEQAAANRQFAFNQAQAGANAFLDALSQQEAVRQAEQALGLDVERLRQSQQQAWLQALTQATGMDVSQRQWAEELGVQRSAQDFGRWLQTQQLNQQAQQVWVDAVLRGAGLGEEARQFERMMPLREAELTGALYGQATLPARQFDWQRALQEAGLTGMWQGQPTWERMLQEAGLTGTYQGQPTWERVLAQQQLGLDRARLGLQQEDLEQTRWWREQQLDLDRQRLAIERNQTMDPLRKMQLGIMQDAVASISVKKNEYAKAGPSDRAKYRQEALTDAAVLYEAGQITSEDYQRLLNTIDVAMPESRQAAFGWGGGFGPLMPNWSLSFPQGMP